MNTKLEEVRREVSYCHSALENRCLGEEGFPPTSGVEASEGLSAKLFLCLPSKGIEKIASDKATGVKKWGLGTLFLTASNPEASELKTRMTQTCALVRQSVWDQISHFGFRVGSTGAL